MSSNGEDIIRETFEKLGDAIGVQMQMPDATITNLGAVLQAQIDLLAELQSAGRLVPAGGMALTAELVEDVRTVVWSEGDIADAAFNRLRALFPATEPAEDAVGDPLQAWKGFLKPKPIGWYRTMELDFAAKHFGFPANPVFEDRYTAPDGGKWQWTDELQWELRCYPTAPVEPAEEETKAEAVEAAINMWVETAYQTTFAGLGHSDAELAAKKAIGEMRHLHLAEPWLLAKRITDILSGDTLPASSPVVPAPTETEWQTWEAVPDDVWFTSTSAVGSLPAHRKRGNLVDWQFRDGSVGVYDVSQTWNAKLMARAPFVAAEEKDA